MLSITTTFRLPGSNDDEQMTLVEFAKYVSDGCLIDYDGWGKLMRGDEVSSLVVTPSSFVENLCYQNFYITPSRTVPIPLWATGVVWYNK